MTHGRLYRTVWRWHFYAGLFCLPFVVWLACTGTIYLFRPQVETWLERRYAQVAQGDVRQPAAAQISAALAEVPHASLNAYEVPEHPGDAVRILVSRNGELTRVFVDPATAHVLGSVAENDRFMRVILQLHGELRMGSAGSMFVELAASWTIFLLLSGLYLWWPPRRGLGGVLYPRLATGGRTFWRDLHAVTGVWVAFFALFLLMSGLPWAKSWGGMLKALRQAQSAVTVQQDWSTGSASERAAIRTAALPPERHAHGGGDAAESVPTAHDYSAIDRVLPAVIGQHLAPPVLIVPPSRRMARWTARSDAASRPLRADLVLDEATGAVIKRTDFAQKPWLDRVIGYGIAIHEGQLFPPLNQVLAVFTAAGLVLMVVSSVVLWWRRRPAGTLGAPPSGIHARYPLPLVAGLIVLACALPLFGISMLAVWAVEWGVLRRIPRTRAFLGC